MSHFWAIIEVIRGLIRLWKEFRAMRERERIREAQEAEKKQNEAIEKQKNAETEEDFDNAQDEIVGNKPH